MLGAKSSSPARRNRSRRARRRTPGTFSNRTWPHAANWSPAPIHAGHPREVDTECGEAGALRADPRTKALPANLLRLRPRQLGDRREPREREVLVVLTRDQRLGPQRRLESQDRRRADAGDERRRIPIVGGAQIDQRRPTEPEY